MSDVVIDIKNISKQYRLGTVGYGTLGQDLQRLWAKVFNKPDPNSTIGKRVEQISSQSDHILALNDISFNVHQGDRLGIIGKNGAGKTTLLKILSRISAPTQGMIKIRGRVASLIAVGAGFHGELTGRENIYLNGTILGLSKADVIKRFDEIVDFSGVEQFIDTPVKRYSSGMYIRLGFAVAAHLDPDILIVDEVLAVGDADFQKKAIGKMKNVSNEEGRTILFVSHNMGMITSLCNQAICLENGNIISSGKASDVARIYLSGSNSSPFMVDFSNFKKKIGNDNAILLHASVKDLKGLEKGEIDIRTSFKISMTYKMNKNTDLIPIPNFHILDERGEYVFTTSPNKPNESFSGIGIYISECIIPGNLLNNGTYFVGLALTFLEKGINISFFEKNAISFSIVDPLEETLFELRNGYSGPIPGPIRPKLNWEITKLE